MNAAQIIAHKRDGRELTSNQIAWFIDGFTRGVIPDYQMSALAMAIFFVGMNPDESAALTEHMLKSGTRLVWHDDGRPVVDKHSTGGVGDKVSLVLAPLLACCDVRVPMISGRGLGPTGGTLDKLESIPGFRTNLSLNELQQQVDRIGCVITGASDELAPADRKLYALRDVTGTVPSIPLITASILSKKLAEGLGALVLDVKWGSGAFMKSRDDAQALADSLQQTGRRLGVETSAELSDMNQPLGRMIGNTVEVDEAIDTLSGGGPADLRTLVLRLGASLLHAIGRKSNDDAAHQRLQQELDSGAALVRFEEMVAAQGGDLSANRKRASTHDVLSPETGQLQGVDTEALGNVIIDIGGGRRSVNDIVDHSVGIEWLVRIGEHINRGQVVAHSFAPSSFATTAIKKIQSSLQF